MFCWIHRKLRPLGVVFNYYPPANITIMFTNFCNLSCPYCYVKEDLNKNFSDKLSLQEWFRLIESIPFYTVINFTGGEVFFDKNFPEIMSQCAKKKIKYSLVTNASLLSDKNIEYIIKHNVSYLMISLDGIGDVHDHNRQKRGLFTYIENVLSKFQKIKNRPHIALKVLLLESNIHQLFDIIKFAENHNAVDELKFSFGVFNEYQNGFKLTSNLDTCFGGLGNTFKYSQRFLRDFKDSEMKLFDLIQKSKKKISFSPRLSRGEKMSSYVENLNSYAVKNCDRPKNEFVIYPNGDITPCTTFKVSNIRNFDYKVSRVLLSDEYARFLDRHNQDMPYGSKCSGCIAGVHTPKI